MSSVHTEYISIKLFQLILLWGPSWGVCNSLLLYFFLPLGLCEHTHVAELLWGTCVVCLSFFSVCVNVCVCVHVCMYMLAWGARMGVSQSQKWNLSLILSIKAELHVQLFLSVLQSTTKDDVVQSQSRVQLFATPCIDCSSPESSALHHLWEFAQNPVHWVCDAI